MNTLNFNPVFRAVMFLVLMLGIPASALAQCDEIAHTRVDTTLYSDVPRLSTAGGWQLATEIAPLPRGTQVRICEAKEVGQFGFNSKIWLRVQLADGRSGWIFAEATDRGGARSNAPAHGWSLISDAVAQEAAQPSNGLPGNGLPGSGLGPWLLLAVTALFVFFGIVGKMVYDGIASRTSIRRCIKLENCIKAVIIAPLAIAAFLQIGDFTLKDESATLIYWCMAFQNGFFWQTLLPTTKSPEPPAA